jgi:hypothetical protein
MAVSVYFAPKSMNAQKYNDAVKRLSAAGQMHPKGRLYHICFGSGDKLQVFEVWASQAEFDAFGKTLMPILKKVGLDPGTPMVAPVQNVIQP